MIGQHATEEGVDSTGREKRGNRKKRENKGKREEGGEGEWEQWIYDRRARGNRAREQ